MRIGFRGFRYVWMDIADAEVDDLDEELLARFATAERSREVVCVTVTTSMGAMRRCLTTAGYLRVAKIETDHPTSTQAEVAEWCAWMRQGRGLTERTIAARCHYAAGLIDVLTTPDSTVGWNRLDASNINAYDAERGRPYGSVARANIVDAVRGLLR